MGFDINVNFPANQAIVDKLDQILEILQSLIKEGEQIMTDLTALTAQVTANTDAEASAIQLITNIANALKNAGTDPVAVAALVTQLENSRAALAAAVVANTVPA
jgi:hypothetical protein